jgi:hypothetical protein
MVRPVSYFLSFWLAMLFVVGQLGQHVPGLMVDAVGLGALIAMLGGMIAPIVSPRLRLAGPIALSLGLFALWGVGLAMKVSPWLPWSIFIGAFCFIGVVIAEVIWSPRNRGTMAPADS